MGPLSPHIMNARGYITLNGVLCSFISWQSPVKAEGISVTTHTPIQTESAVVENTRISASFCMRADVRAALVFLLFGVLISSI